jgi:hypothetical protein
MEHWTNSLNRLHGLIMRLQRWQKCTEYDRDNKGYLTFDTGLSFRSIAWWMSNEACWKWICILRPIRLIRVVRMSSLSSSWFRCTWRCSLSVQQPTRFGIQSPTGSWRANRALRCTVAIGNRQMTPHPGVSCHQSERDRLNMNRTSAKPPVRWSALKSTGKSLQMEMTAFHWTSPR